MTTAVEHITQEIRRLAPDQVRELFDVLRRQFQLTPQTTQDDMASVESDWDEKIDRRYQEIEKNEVELLPASVFQRGTETLLARLGVKKLHS